MSDQSRTARRYHWLSQSVTSFVNEPHEAVCSGQTAPTLNLVAAEHEQLRSASVELAAARDEYRSPCGAGRKTRLCPGRLLFDEPLSPSARRRPGVRTSRCPNATRADIVNRADVRVSERRGSTCLAAESLE